MPMPIWSGLLHWIVDRFGRSDRLTVIASSKRPVIRAFFLMYVRRCIYVNMCALSCLLSRCSEAMQHAHRQAQFVELHQRRAGGAGEVGVVSARDVPLCAIGERHPITEPPAA